MTRFRVRSPPPHGREQSDLTRCVQSPFNSLQILQFIWRCGACCNISMTHDVVVMKVTRTQTNKYMKEWRDRDWHCVFVTASLAPHGPLVALKLAGYKVKLKRLWAIPSSRFFLIIYLLFSLIHSFLAVDLHTCTHTLWKLLRPGWCPDN